jgi:uncharacterized membrane protein YphA (DoxX/SURF4 family)
MKKRNRIIYWISTLWLSLGMAATGLVQLFRIRSEGAVAPPGADGMAQLGYPVYLLTIIGVWKILGVIAILIPRSPLLKEWAYAGFFFLMSGAVFSHIGSGDPLNTFFPSFLLLFLVLASWYFRPSDRKTVAARVKMNGKNTPIMMEDALTVPAAAL